MIFNRRVLPLLLMIAACSYLDNLENGNFHLTSDCTSPATSLDFAAVNYQIAPESGLNYSDFGFPNDSVKASDNIGVLNGVIRQCYLIYGENTGDYWYFTCFEDDRFVCEIHIDKLE